jgi:CDP-paratose 2-epimerase
MRYLITGGCGFLGSNLSAAVLARDGELAVLDNLGRVGSGHNLEWLESQGGFAHYDGDIRDPGLVASVVRDYRPDMVFHLAGQVAMTTSIEDPRLDFEINALGTLNVLEALRRHAPEAGLLYSSTNKVYGDLEWVRYEETATRYTAPDFPDGFGEDVPLDFRSPYGCSKGAADAYILDYSRIFGLRTAVFRHSSMYGGRQYATFDQGWVGWFCTKAVEAARGRAAEPFTISGSGKQVRDILHADDMIELYFRACSHLDRISGLAFNIGGGMENSSSLLELFAFLESELDTTLNYRRLPPRASDQKVFVADVGRIRELTGWKPVVDKASGIRRMLEWVEGL